MNARILRLKLLGSSIGWEVTLLQSLIVDPVVCCPLVLRNNLTTHLLDKTLSNVFHHATAAMLTGATLVIHHLLLVIILVAKSVELIERELHSFQDPTFAVSEQLLDGLRRGCLAYAEEALKEDSGDHLAQVEELIVIAHLALVEEGEVGVGMVLEDHRIICTHGELKALNFSLFRFAL